MISVLILVCRQAHVSKEFLVSSFDPGFNGRPELKGENE